jgi:hypothetical protein
MKVFPRSSHLTCGLLLVLILGLPAPPSFGGKPQPPAPPPPPVPVRYAIQYFRSPGGGGYLNDFNNRSQAVGWFLDPRDGQKRAWLYDPSVDREDVVDLNTLVPEAAVPEGWIIASAVGLNERGDIVGYLELNGDPSTDPIRRGYVLDMSTLDLNASPPTLATLMLIPDNAYGYTYAKDLNDEGLVLGTYYVPDGTPWNGNNTSGMYLYQAGLYDNPADLVVRDLGLFVKNVERTRLGETPPDEADNRLPAQFAGNRLDGVAYRYTEGQPLELFPELSNVVNSNTAGGFCGSGIYQPPRGKSFRAPIRVLGADPEILKSLPGKTATALNRRGDLVIDNECLYWDAHGLYHINSLVAGEPVTMALWNGTTIVKGIRAINDPNATGYGEAVGNITFADGTRAFFYLTPIPAP